MKRVTFSLVLGLLGFALFVTSVALAASSQPLTPPTEASPLLPASISGTVPISGTDGISPTTTFTHPVASAVAEYFEVDYSEIAGLHEDGFGFGVIARAYFVAQTLEMSPTTLLDEFAAGTGWGVILKEYGLHPGQGRDRNLGCIRSGRCQNGEEFGSTSTGANVPPGQLKKSDDANSDDDKGHGPPSTPPGRDPNKKKGKKN